MAYSAFLCGFMSKKKKEKIHVGGQAVIEGVMMRSPEYVAVAVRQPDGKIALKREKYISWTKKNKLLGLPLIRGGVILIESLVLGIKALNFSSEIAMQEENKKSKKKKKKKDPSKSDLGTKVSLVMTMMFSFVIGLGIFFYLPLILTEMTGVNGGVLFNLIDGVIRLIFFLLYIYLISLWKEIRRVFEYHGAEHVSIFAFESGLDLTPESTKKFSTHHPRCGTSFLLIVMLVSMLIFMVLGKPETLSDRLIRFLFIPVIGGLSYEIIKLTDKKVGAFLAKTLILPGLWLQQITTQPPKDDQIEVALVALKSSLDMKIEDSLNVVTVQ